MTANDQILREAMAAWNRGDFDAALESVDADVRWETSGLFPGLDPVYEGHDELRSFWNEFMAPWESISLEVIEMDEPRPDRIVALVRFRATGRQGIEVDLETWQLFVFRAGRLVFFRPYRERAEALTAAADS